MTNPMMPRAVAVGLLAVLAAGCSTQPAAEGGDSAAKNASTVRATAPPTIATDVVPACQAHDLGVTFIGGQPGAGNDFATIVAWDPGPIACRIAGPVTLVGLGPDGTADTNVVRLTVVASGVLTPRGTAPGPNQVLPPGESAAWLLVSAEYRDDPLTGALCTPHQVEPATFRLSLPGGGTITVTNADTHQPPVYSLDKNGGLLTCRGELNTGPNATQIIIGSAL